MLETEQTSPTLAAQCRLLGDTLRRSLTHPTTLLYPAFKSLLATGLVLLLGVSFLVPVSGIGPDVPIGPLTMVVVVGFSVSLLYVLGPILAVGLDVAYCYELGVLADGSRPLPGSGLVFAARRLPRITLGALAVSGTFLAGYVTDTDSLRVGSGVLDVLLAPALATEDGPVRDLVAHIESAATDQWGSAALAVYGVGTVAKALGTLCTAGAVAVVVGYWLGVVPFVATIGQALALAVALLLGGLALATFCKSLVDGPVAMALYQQARTDGEPTHGSKTLEAVREIQ
ncbi:hypothetical protein [Haloarcula onubensis]|uniref:Uncharacterized protein n=1 Tax=Haloarcula onubensis TaxID=2950539 RepID=A0ABU2FRP0_9EURY|nr:hypothetical protein [Halomicroarcula sp. S3CR25-11]MDS0282947.1 hypothetical protein [Halomicroarcula sp. S3CR25-11]